MKFLYLTFCTQAFFISSMTYASSNINLEIENHYYTKTTKLCGTIVYAEGNNDENRTFTALVNRRKHPESFGTLALPVPNKHFKSISLGLFEKDAPEDGTATAYAFGSYDFPSRYISKLQAKIFQSNIIIKSTPNLPPKFTNN